MLETLKICMQGDPWCGSRIFSHFQRMEGQSLEHGLAQKLMIMENAAAKVATLRAQLRTNVDQARKEVRAVMSQQMMLLRAREQELLDELDVIMNHKESKLELQQQSLYRNIWECKQALDKIRGSGSSADAMQVFSRVGHVELSSRESAHVSFESDAIGLRSKLLSFGTIRTSSRHDQGNYTTPGESLPMDFEEYDDALMAHKSVLRMRSNPTSSSMSRQQVESVTKWLKKIPSGPGALDADVSTLMAEFDVIKNSSTPEAEVESTDSASSFDIIAPKDGNVPETPVEKVLSAEFLNTLQQPLSSWLMRIMPSEHKAATETAVTTPVEESPRSMKRPHSCGEIRRYGFQNVISSVNASSNDSWILESEPSKKTRTEEKAESSSTGSVKTSRPEDASVSEQEETQNDPPFNESEFISHLSRLFLCNSTSAPHGTADKPSTQGIDLSTVLGWKQVLDRIEQSAPYWLQDKKQ
ncbi:unnamed protein product [Cylicocyclus nassatus]|uniref:Uncharacterized protein n=1 Tax=Cylicocyclus nassatus TaxID=53992 RepID=A0AA36DQG4_CYLNA|nr:unnamed protein product [Cylicocyclus nassatus]